MYKIYSYYIFNNIYKNKMYKFFIWIFLLIMTFFTVRKYNQLNIFEGIGLTFTDQNFLCLCYLVFSFLITIKINTEYKNNDFIKIRFIDKKKYHKEILKSNFLCQTIYFIIVLILAMILFNLMSLSSYSIIYLEQFKMNSLVFCLYSLLKIYLFTILLSTINTYLLSKINEYYIYTYNVLLYMFILVNAHLQSKIITSFISSFVGNSLISSTYYSNYYYDITNYMFHTLLIIIIFYVIKEVSKK